jgi:hypothetical protein
VEVLTELRGDTIATRQLADATSITGALQRGRR